MSHEETSQGFEFVCDTCGNVRPPGKLGRGSYKRDFAEEWEDARDDGWRAYKDANGTWRHKCPQC